MSREEFNTEGRAAESYLKRMADEENKKIFNPDSKRIKELNDKYMSIMADYEKAIDTNEDAAEEILKQANAVLEELNSIDSKLPGSQKLQVPNLDDLKDEADDLTKDLNSRPTLH